MYIQKICEYTVSNPGYNFNITQNTNVLFSSNFYVFVFMFKTQAD